MLDAAPVVLLVRQALLARTGPAGVLEWYPPGLLTAWLTGLGVAALGAAIVYLGGPSGIETSLKMILAPALDQFAETGDANREELTKLVALVTPGALATSWMVMTASNAILAQGSPSANWQGVAAITRSCGLDIAALAFRVFGCWRGAARCWGAADVSSASTF